MLPGSKVLHAEPSKVVHPCSSSAAEIAALGRVPRPPVRLPPAGPSYGASELVVLGALGFVAKDVIGSCHAP